MAGVVRVHPAGKGLRFHAKDSKKHSGTIA
jgi:hypothetical protein